MTGIAPRFEPGHRAPARADEAAYWCLFRGGRVAVRRAAGGPALPELERTGAGTGEGAHYLGMLDGRHCFAAVLPEGEALPPGTELIGLRAMFLEADTQVAEVAGRGFQVLEWDRTHRYCGLCGVPTVYHAVDRARECPSCRHVFYPRVSPVVMAIVHRGQEVLLTRKPGYAPGRYTVVAGFVEGGEALEHALAREVLEETGVTVGAMRYFGSQPWPFPHALVMAFSLEYAGGKARADGVELEEARWFHIDELPELPEPVHISRQLIDDTVARLRALGE